jgi:tetratricopeptide (TPR) repeat protein
MTGLRLGASLGLAAVLATQSYAVRAQEPAPAAAGVLPPARSNLVAVPLPPLDALEPVVASQLREARRTFESAAAGAGTRDLAEAYGALGRVFHAYEFVETAEPAYANAIRLSAGDGRWPHLLGFLFQQTGRLKESADRLLAARRVQPDAPAVAMRLGDVYIGLNRLRDAREQFESVLATFPAAARNGLGEVALREGRFREAVEHFEAALERVPQAVSIHYSLAMAYRGLGRLDDARSHLQRRGPGGITVVDPLVESLQTLVRGERLLVIQGSRAYAAGRFADAARLFERALAAAPDSVPARVNLASALVQLGDVPRAVEQLQNAYARAPADVESTLIELTLLLSERERYGEAIALLEGAERGVPGRPAAATTLARLLSSSPDLAVRDGRRALELAMRVHETRSAPADSETVALALAELGRCPEALDWMRRAVASAERAGDAMETTRLKGELRRYDAAACRAPGR